MTDLPRAVIEPHRVLIDGVELPGFIAEDGVSVIPGGHRGVNRVQITFLCGEMVTEDVSKYECMEACDGTITWDRKSE